MRLVLRMALLTLAACERPDGEAHGTGGGPKDLSSAISTMRDAPSAWDGLARLRCERLRRCEELGPRAKYDDYASCVATERSALQIALPRERCKALAGDPLHECGQAIAGGTCEEPHDDESLVANVGSCAAAKVCVSGR